MTHVVITSNYGDRIPALFIYANTARMHYVMGSAYDVDMDSDFRYNFFIHSYFSVAHHHHITLTSTSAVPARALAHLRVVVVVAVIVTVVIRSNAVDLPCVVMMFSSTRCHPIQSNDLFVW